MSHMASCSGKQSSLKSGGTGSTGGDDTKVRKLSGSRLLQFGRRAGQ
jgi:hypothetical protein